MKTLTKKSLTVALILSMLCAVIAGIMLFVTPVKANVTSITIEETAEIRVENTGIRFMITVNNAEYADLTKVGGEYEGYTASVGAVILPTDILGSKELKVDGDYDAYNPRVQELTVTDVKHSDETSTRYNVVMTDIPAESYEQDLSARGFIKLVKTGETDKYIYTDVTASRSIAYVATAAYNASETSQENKTAIATLLQNAMTSTTASFDKSTYEFSRSTSMESDFTLYGNEYNFVPDATWASTNISYVFGTQDIAKIEDGKIKALGSGTTTLTAKLGETEIATTNITVAPYATDNTTRALSISDGTLDLSGLGIEMSSVSKMKIGDTLLTTNGSLPAMEMEVDGPNQLKLTVDGITDSISISKVATNKDFNAVPMLLVLDNGNEYQLNGVQVYNKVLKDADDITELFGAANAANHLDGYYVLGNDIDASSANVSGGLRYSTTATDTTSYGNNKAAHFRGLFDGMGHIISNLDLSAPSNKAASLFGQVRLDKSTSVGTIRNVAFVNVNATNGMVICSLAESYATSRASIISNVYASVSADTSNFQGLFGNISGCISANNCIVDYPKQENIGNNYGSFTASENAKFISESSNNYVISKTPLSIKDGVERTDLADTVVKRYDTLSAMTADAGNRDFTSFSSDYWTMTNGVPVWNNVPVSDSTERALEVDEGSLDLTGLGFALSDVASVKINGTTLPVTDGVLPTMSMKVVKNAQNVNSLSLTVDGITDAISITKGTGNKDFNSIPMTITLDSGVEYNLTGVKVYNKVLKDADDITELFGANNATNHLAGYYVLGNHIDASTSQVSGGLRYSTSATDKTYGNAAQFVGIFDGMGYAISNLDVSSIYTKPGSLFGQITTNNPVSVPTIQNVAFINVKATYAAVISTTFTYSTVMPVISNVYVSVSSDTQHFMGIARGGSGSVDHCIIEYPVLEDVTSHSGGGYNEYGSFMPTANGTLRAGSHNYVISQTPVSYVGATDSTEVSNSFVTRYSDLDAMIADKANKDYTSFSSIYCWTISADGIPVWANMPPVVSAE